MSFNVALSGLRAANQDLNVTGNNIANASTVGFKSSRAEFADVYANSVLGSGGRSPGSGAVVADIAQQFGQGNISITNNSLDLAISGQGFFVLKDQAGSLMYSRSGIFGLDKEGYVVANNGAELQGFPADPNGNIVEGAPEPLRISTTDRPPNKTSEVNLRFNLDSRSKVITEDFDPADANTYHWSTAATVYDSLGNQETLTTYYQKSSDDPSQWNVYASLGGSFYSGNEVDGTLTATPADSAADPIPALTAITFSSDGSVTGLPNTLNLNKPAEGGAAAQTIALNFGASTQYGDVFSVKNLRQDGYAPGRLTGVSIEQDGVIFARYTNGESMRLGKVALANFDNPQGLIPIGGTNWVESSSSGQPIIGGPQTGALGAIQSGALEDSNVDLSMELVNLIIAQRNYQANAKTIETTNAVTQSVINLR